MATVTLVEVQPRQASDAAVVTVRLAGGGTRAYTQRGQSDWLAGVARPPRFSSALGFDQRGFTGGALPQTGAVRFAPSRGEVKTALGGLVWQGARIVVRVGDDQNPFEDYPVEFIGTVASHSFDRGALALTVADLSVDLAKPVLSGAFAGTGGLEGDEEATGRAKRRSWGSVFNVEGFILDKANLVYEFGDPARKLTGFPLVKDKGDAYDPIVAVDWQGSADATLATLRATAVPEGGVAVAPSISCVKPWTRPAGPITADLIAEAVAGNGSRPAWIAAKIVREFSPTIALPNENDAAGWQGAESGIHAAELSETAASILDRLLFPVSIAWVLLGNGQLYFRRLSWAEPVFELNAETVDREIVYPPLRTRRLGFQLNNRIHTDGEISATLLASVDPTYADGTPIDVLRPAEAGANVTESRSAASFYGQGALATLNQLANGGPYLSGFGGLSFADIVRLGSTVADSFGTVLTNAQVITGQGTAAAIFGQGLLATLNQLANGSQYLSGFGGLSSQNYAFLGSTIADSFGSILSNGQVITAQGTAAALFGQGALATLNFVRYSDQVSGRPQNVSNLVLRPTFADGSRGTWGDDGPTTVVDVVGQSFAKAGRSIYRDTLEGGNIIPVTEGETLYFDVWLNSEESAVGVGAGVFTRDKAGNINFPLPVSIPPGTGWSRRSAPYTVPPGVVSVQPWVWCNYDGSGSSAVKWAEFQLTRAQLGATVGGRLGTNILREGGGIATDALLVTALGIASGFTGQSPWATFSAPTSRVDKIDNDGNIPAGGVYLPGVAFLNERWPEEASSNRTESRTSAGFYGQGVLATLNSLSYGGGRITDFPTAIAPANLRPGGNIDFFWIQDYSSVRLSERWPQEGGANVTENRTSAALYGQGALATLNAVSYGSQISGLPVSLVQGFGLGIRLDGSIDPYFSTWNDGVRVSDRQPQEANANVTETRTASAITGQTQFATLPAGTSLDNGVFGMPSRLGNYGGFLSADQMTYTGGPGTVSVASLRPSEANANVTEGRTSAAIAGQGALATQNAAAYGSQIAGLPVSLTQGQGLGIRTNGLIDPYFSTWNDGVRVSDRQPQEAGANITEARSAASFYGQGSFATQSYLSLTNTAYFAADGRFEASSLGQSYFRADRMAFAGGNTVEGLKPGEAGANVTETRTASAIVGQQYLATNYPARLYGSPQHGDSYLAASAMAFAGGNTVEGLRPGEAGANVTEARQAASIYGQSGFATASNITRDNIFSAGFFNLNAFSLGYSVTRSDGTTTVTESLVVTQVGIAAGFYGQAALATRNDVDTPQIVENAATNTVAVSAGALNVPAGGEANGVSAAISAIGRPVAVFFTCDSAVGSQFTATGIFQLRRVQNGEDVQVGRNFTMTRTSPGPLNFLHYVNTPAAGSVTYYVRYVHTGGTGNIFVSNQYLTLIETKR